MFYKGALQPYIKLMQKLVHRRVKRSCARTKRASNFPKAAQSENKCRLSFVADSAAAGGFRSRKKRGMNNKIQLPETTLLN